MQDLAALGALLLTTKFVGEFTARIGLSPIPGEVLAGLILGPALLGWFSPSAFVDQFAYIGVLLLLFLVGIGTRMEALEDKLKPAFMIAAGGMFSVLLIVFTLAMFAFKFPLGQALLLGTVAASSSTVVAVRILAENNYLQTKNGKLVLGTALADDLLNLLLMTLTLNYLASEVFSLKQTFTLLFVIVGFIVVVMKTGPSLLSIFNLFERMKIEYSLISIPFAIVLLLASFAEEFKVTGAIGAFLAGMVMSKIPQVTNTLTEKVRTIGYAIFIPVFFANVGLHAVSFADINWAFAILLISLAVAVKYYACGMTAANYGYKRSLVGWCMVPRGEMSLVTVQLAIAQGLMNPPLVSYITLLILFPSILAPLFIRKYAVARD